MFVCLVVHCPFREIPVVLPGFGTAVAREALPARIGVCSIFLCPNNGMAASVWNFNVHIDVDACDCTPGLYGQDTVTESALKVDSERKIA